MNSLSIRIDSLPRGVGGQQRYTVYFSGECLIERARDPEYEACRVLRDRGYSGMLKTYWRHSDVPSMVLDIKHAAERSTTEGVNTVVRVSKYSPFDSSTFGRDGSAQKTVDVA